MGIPPKHVLIKISELTQLQGVTGTSHPVLSSLFFPLKFRNHWVTKTVIFVEESGHCKSGLYIIFFLDFTDTLGWRTISTTQEFQHSISEVILSQGKKALGFLILSLPSLLGSGRGGDPARDRGEGWWLTSICMHLKYKSLYYIIKYKTLD